MNNMLFYFLLGAVMMLSLLGLWLAFIMPGLDGWRKRYFKLLFLDLSLCMLTYLLDMLVCEPSGSVTAVKIMWFLESLLISVPMPMLIIYLLHCCGESTRKSPLARWVSVLWLVYIALLTASQFTPFLYDVGADLQFVRGSWYPLGLAPLIAITILDFRAVIRRRGLLSAKTYHALLTYLIPLVIAMIINTCVLNYVIVDVGVTVSSFGMFSIILFEQTEQYMRQQREIARQQASILVLQMRPHFIYNTMTGIYYLCDQDPQKAKQVTLDFTTYLRKNFTAIASVDTIPFSEELEHTRAYLAVEQAQFEDSLFVDCDTPFTQFRLPPLTLQPIVENAVKHGMDPDSEPLHITIRTGLDDSCVELIVTDDGPGYTPSEDNEPHIALKNIGQRLEMMCGGKLLILANESGGTTVKVLIPV